MEEAKNQIAAKTQEVKNNIQAAQNAISDSKVQAQQAKNVVDNMKNQKDALEEAGKKTTADLEKARNDKAAAANQQKELQKKQDIKTDEKKK